MNAMKELEKLMEENKDVLIRLKEGKENKNMTIWERNANHVALTYGSHVDWEERFYECPSCGEPVYECDWSENDLTNFICPICEDINLEEE